MTNEITTKTNKIRNPFPGVLKVFKYEMMHSYRILIPVYVALIIIASLAGLSVFSDIDSIDIKRQIGSSSFSYQISSMVQSLLMMASTVIGIASLVITIVLINKRFKTGLLGDEAYLNLTLPITMGEHVWGRILASAVWIIAYFISSTLAVVAFMAKLMPEIIPEIIEYYGPELESRGLTFNSAFAMLLQIAIGLLELIVFAYLINAIGHLAKKHRTVVKLAAIIVLGFISIKIAGAIMPSQETGFDIDGLAFRIKPSVFYIGALINCAMTVIYGIATQLILKLKLNLE